MHRYELLLSDEIVSELSVLCDGTIATNVDSSKFVSLRAGGPLACIVTPESTNSLSDLLRFCDSNQIPTFCLGKGSNLLVRDRGFPGVAIRTERCCVGISIVENTVRIGSGIALPRYANECFRNKLTGAEWAIGVPGTIGGAVCMNAGCHGVVTNDFLQTVESISASGDPLIRQGTQCEFGHRTSRYQDSSEVVTAATFELREAPRDQVRAAMQEYLSYRRRVQPTGTANCGSTFRNPEGHSAWQLINRSGLGGTRVGGIMVSEKHGNFLVNDRNACADDILNLIERVREVVYERFDVTLVPELRVLGEEGFQHWPEA